MLRLVTPQRERAENKRRGAAARRVPAGAGGKIAYGSVFWCAYCANTGLMIAVSLLFRYGDFIKLIGGTEFMLGLIVGVGMVGGIFMRVVQGVAIDRYGPGRVWRLSLVGMILTMLFHTVLGNAGGPGLFLARIIYQTSLAGAFGASIAYISLRAPADRMAEMVGMLGSSGFVGMFLGTQLGDALFPAEGIERWHVNRMFLVAALLGRGSLALAWGATRGQRFVGRQRKRPPLLALVRRYQPGPILLMAVAMGIGIGLPGTFLRPYTETLGIPTIGTFFGVYAVTAFATRLLTRKVPDRIGLGRAALIGMGFLVASLLLYLPVRSAWHLVWPGLMAGFAHALLFPAIVAGGSRSFPTRYRGLAVTLTLGMFDIGNFVGMPLSGALADAFGYDVMYVAVAVLLVAASGYFAWWSSER